MKSDSHVTLIERNELLREAIEIIAYSDIRLGTSIKNEVTAAAKKQLLEKIDMLQREQIRFSPKLDVCVVDALKLKESGGEIPDDLQDKINLSQNKPKQND